MRLLILGGGAREHALVWKLKQSPLVSKVYAAPGNPGMLQLAALTSCDINNPREVTALALNLQIDLVVIGPEAPLAAAVADALRDAQIDVFAPSRAAACVETSKAFAKEVMLSAGVPTAKYEIFGDARAAIQRVSSWVPVVIKADGLAAGKGVVVAHSREVAVAACTELCKLSAGRRILLEECLEGPELSIIALCDGHRFVLLPPAQDYKRLRDEDAGPNTGGMGSYAPARYLSEAALTEVGNKVIAPTLAELARRGAPFQGALYAGIMLTPAGIKVLEFNARLGDPETQSLMVLLKDDLVPILRSCARGQLDAARIHTHPGVTVSVVLAAHGYPFTPQLGDRIDGLEAMHRPGVHIFHAGTCLDGQRLVSSAGRVLTVCAHAEDTLLARTSAYNAIAQLNFQGCHFRRDIALKAPQPS